MPFVETEWWSVEIPEEWSALREDDVTSIVDCDEVGALDISEMRKSEGELTQDDLVLLTEENTEKGRQASPVQIAELHGLYFEFHEDDAAWREWYLCGGNTLLYITYCTDIENKGIDEVVVDQILSTLVLCDDAD